MVSHLLACWLSSLRSCSATPYPPSKTSKASPTLPSSILPLTSLLSSLHKHDFVIMHCFVPWMFVPMFHSLSPGQGHTVTTGAHHRVPARGPAHGRQLEDCGCGDSLTWFPIPPSSACHEPSPISCVLGSQKVHLSTTLLTAVAGTTMGHLDLSGNEGIISPGPRSAAGSKHSVISP